MKKLMKSAAEDLKALLQDKEVIEALTKAESKEDPKHEKPKKAKDESIADGGSDSKPKAVDVLDAEETSHGESNKDDMVPGARTQYNVAERSIYDNKKPFKKDEMDGKPKSRYHEAKHRFLAKVHGHGNPDAKQDAQLGEDVEHLVEDHMQANKGAEQAEGHQVTKQELGLKEGDNQETKSKMSLAEPKYKAPGNDQGVRSEKPAMHTGDQPNKADPNMPKSRYQMEKAEYLGKPYTSDAQRRWAHTENGEKALGGPKKVHEWDESSKGKKLPEHVKKDELAKEHIGFNKLKGELAHEKGVHNPGAVAAAIGRKKYGAEGMAHKAAAGKMKKDDMDGDMSSDMAMSEMKKSFMDAAGEFLKKARSDEGLSPQRKASARAKRNDRSISLKPEKTTLKQYYNFHDKKGAVSGKKGQKIYGIPKRAKETGIHGENENHKSGPLKGRSVAGVNAEWAGKHKNAGPAYHAKQKAHAIHSKVLGDLKAMPKPNLPKTEKAEPGSHPDTPTAPRPKMGGMHKEKTAKQPSAVTKMPNIQVKTGGFSNGMIKAAIPPSNKPKVNIPPKGTQLKLKGPIKPESINRLKDAGYGVTMKSAKDESELDKAKEEQNLSSREKVHVREKRSENNKHKIDPLSRKIKGTYQKPQGHHLDVQAYTTLNHATTPRRIILAHQKASSKSTREDIRRQPKPNLPKSELDKASFGEKERIVGHAASGKKLIAPSKRHFKKLDPKLPMKKDESPAQPSSGDMSAWKDWNSKKPAGMQNSNWQGNVAEKMQSGFTGQNTGTPQPTNKGEINGNDDPAHRSPEWANKLKPHTHDASGKLKSPKSEEDHPSDPNDSLEEIFGLKNPRNSKAYKELKKK